MKMPPVVFLVVALCAIALSPILAAPTVVGTIDPSPGPDGFGTELHVYDPATGRIFGIGGTNVSDGAYRVVAISAATGLVVGTAPVDARELRVATLGGLALDSAGGRLYAIDPGLASKSIEPKVVALDTTTLAPVRTYSFPFVSPRKIVVHAGAQKAFLQLESGSIIELDLVSGASRSVTGASPQGRTAISEPANKFFAWHYHESSPLLLTYNVATGQAAAGALTSSFDFRSMVVSAAGDRLYLIGQQYHPTAPEATRYTGRIYTVDTATSTLVGSPIDVGTQLFDGAFDPAAGALYVSGYDSPLSNHRLWKVNLASGTSTLLAQYQRDSNIFAPFVYVPESRTIHAAGGAFFTPQIYTVHTGTLAAWGYDVTFQPYAVAVNSMTNKVYSRDSLSGTLIVADGATRQITARVRVGGPAYPHGSSVAASIAVNSSTQRAYTSLYAYNNSVETSSVAVLDTATDQVIANVPITFGAYKRTNMVLAVDETTDRVFVAYTDTNEMMGGKLAIIDGATGSPTEHTILKTLDIPGQVLAIAFNPATSRLYVGHRLGGEANFTVIDAVTVMNSSPSITRVNGGYDYPAAIAVNPVTNRIYVTDWYGLSVHVFNGATNGKITTIAINTTQNPYSDGLFGVAVDPSTNRIYVSDNAHNPILKNTLNVIDGATNAVSTLGLEIGGYPHHVAVNPVTHQVFIAQERGSDIIVIDDSPPPSITTSAFPQNGGVLEIKDAKGEVTFAVVGAGGVLTDQLPTGQKLFPAGVVNGTAQPGTYTVVIRVSEVETPSRFSDRTYTFTVQPPPLPSITTSDFPVTGGTLTATGGSQPLTFAIVDGNKTTDQVPTGQTLASNGVVTGTAEPGPYTFKVRVTEGSGLRRSVERTYSFTAPGIFNPLKVTVRERDGAEIKQGGFISYEWTITNTGPKTIFNTQFTIEPPHGFVLQDVGSLAFVGADGETSGVPLDPVTKKQAKIPGTKFNPFLTNSTKTFDLNGFKVPHQHAIFAIGSMLAGGTQKVRAEFRFAYDFPVGPVFEFDQAAASFQLNARSRPERKMSKVQLQVSPGDPGANRPTLKLIMTHQGADRDPENADIATVTQNTLAVPFTPPMTPKRASNQILFRATIANSGGVGAGFLRLSIPIPAHTQYLPGSARVFRLAGDEPLPNPRVEGNLLTFTVPRLEKNFPEGAHSYASIYFRVKVNGSVPVGTEIVQTGGQLMSYELMKPVRSFKKHLTRVVRPALMSGYATGDPVNYSAPAGQKVGAYLFYHNSGGAPGRGVTVKYVVPPGLANSVAFLCDHLGKPLGSNIPAVEGVITVNVGTVNPGKFGFVRVLSLADPGTRPFTGSAATRHRSPTEFTAAYREGEAERQFVPAPVALSGPSAVRAERSTVSTAADEAATASAENGKMGHPHTGADLAGVFIALDGPTQAFPGDEVIYRVTLGNHSNVDTPKGALLIPVPAGAEYVDRSDWKQYGSDDFIAFIRTSGGERGFMTWTSAVLPKHSARTVMLKMRITGAPGTKVITSHGVFSSDTASSIYNQPHQLTVLDPADSVSVQQLNVWSSATGAVASDAFGTPSSPSRAFTANLSLISPVTRLLTIAGTDYAELPDLGLIVIPLGGGKMVAAGAGNVVVQGSGSMVAAGAGNVVAGEAANLQIDVPGFGLLDGYQLIRKAPEMVAAGGMNLISTPTATNLVGQDGGSLVGQDGGSLVGQDGGSLVGLNGATLVGMDGASLGQFLFDSRNARFQRFVNGSPSGVPLLLPKSNVNMVAAGAGNLVVAGGGKVLSVGSDGNLVGNDGAGLLGLGGTALVGQDGGSLVGQDGGSIKEISKLPTPRVGLDPTNLIGNNGSMFMGNDRSSVTTAGPKMLTSGGTGLAPNGGHVVPTGGHH